MKIHFAYAGDPENQLIHAPYSITRNAYQALKTRGEVVYYDWLHMGDFHIAPGDVVIGHPHYDPRTVIQRMFKDGSPCRAKCLIHPFHTRRVEDNFPFDPLVAIATKTFLICGPYWMDTIAATPFAHWAPKAVHLTQGVDTNHFMRVKTKFNEKGQRRLLYIGSAMPQKNLDLMVEIMTRLPHVNLHWYGANGVSKLAHLRNVTNKEWTAFTPDAMQRLAAECDIFINTSISDASPTTVMEASAMGFPVACTPESGFYNSPMVDELKLDDIDYNIGVITRLLEESEENLLARGSAGRDVVCREYSWERFRQYLLNEFDKCVS